MELKISERSARIHADHAGVPIRYNGAALFKCGKTAVSGFLNSHAEPVMLKIPFYGVQIGLGVTLVSWAVFIGWCLMAGRGKRSVALGTLAAILLVFPVASVGAMYGITPCFEYRGGAGTIREWNEQWVRPPENSVKIAFEKKIISGAFYGTTDRASWDAWREKNGMVEPSSTSLFPSNFLQVLDPHSGTWSGYGSKVRPNGARQRTWFREEDGMVAYYANYW